MALDFDATAPDWRLNALGNFVAKNPLDASYYVKLMEFESLACRLVHDACRLMYRVPSLFLAFATWHDDSETTPETTTREKKLQLITLRPTIFYFFHQCQLHSFHENAFHNCVLSHGFFFLYWFALSLVIYQPRARLAFVRQWFFDNIITTQLLHIAFQ